MSDIKYSTVHYLIAMLKAYNIKYVVASPGTQNATFNLFIQDDKFFKPYSVVDERSAAYVATGMAFESSEPVVITCTEATASRNYLSALTEAYYRDLPVIACTFYNPSLNKFSLSPQYSDRSVSQNDVKNISLELPNINSVADKQKVLTYLNVALYNAKYKKKCVHINCPAMLNMTDVDNINTLPNDIWITKRYSDNFTNLQYEFENKKVAVFIGSHHKFDKETQDSISKFASTYNIPVICDHISNYHGKNKILVSQLTRIIKTENTPDIIIDIGHVIGNYTINKLIKNAKIWRISPDGEFRARNNIITEKIFDCSEKTFFRSFNDNKKTNYSNYYQTLKNDVESFVLGELPYSTAYIAKHLTQNLPKNAVLHLGILNSLRCCGYFEIDESIDVVSNVGGFGIDGPLSTLIGQSFVNIDKKYFGLIGDLAFFYDMNILGNHNIKNNLRILLVNNNKGVEFHLGPYKQIKNKDDRLNQLVAAEGHYQNGAQAWAESCGFEYIKATNKEEFINNIVNFCSKDYNKPVIFECFTTSLDEEIGVEKLIKG